MAGAKGGGATVAIIIILLLAVLGGGGWYYWTQMRPAAAGSTPAPGAGAGGAIGPAPGPAPAAATSAPRGPDYSRQAVVVDAANAQIRTGASELAPVVARLNGGETVAVATEDGEWWQVRTPAGVTGYIRAASLRLGDEAAAAPAPETPAAQPLPGPPIAPPPARPVASPPRQARPPAPQRPRRPPPVRDRINRGNAKTMELFCAGAGRGTPQCRRFSRHGG